MGLEILHSKIAGMEIEFSFPDNPTLEFTSPDSVNEYFPIIFYRLLHLYHELFHLWFKINLSFPA